MQERERKGRKCYEIWRRLVFLQSERDLFSQRARARMLCLTGRQIPTQRERKTNIQDSEQTISVFRTKIGLFCIQNVYFLQMNMDVQ